MKNYKNTKVRSKSSLLTLIAVIILLLSLSGSLITIYITRSINTGAENINKLGIIRGSIQKLVKLELYGEKNDKLIEEIDLRISEFESNENDAYIKDYRVRDSIDELVPSWQSLKKAIVDYRSEPVDFNEESLLEISDELWVQTNNMVYTSQEVYEDKVSKYNITYFFLTINFLLGVFFVFLIRKHVKMNLEILVNQDELTPLFNKRYFNDSLYNEILKSERYQTSFSLIFFDIDYFKKVNDTYGHDVGDQVLKELSMIVMENIRKSDIFARVGGEEFAIIALETDLKQSIKVSEKIRKAVENHKFKYVDKITISLGVTEYVNGDSVDTIFKRADIALYKAKNNGRNRSEIEAIE